MLTRALLLKDLSNYEFVPPTNLVDVHMGRLRHKVDEPHEPMILNFRGVGSSCVRLADFARTTTFRRTLAIAARADTRAGWYPEPVILTGRG
jgi:hypothetical protein